MNAEAKKALDDALEMEIEQIVYGVYRRGFGAGFGFGFGFACAICGALIFFWMR